MNLVPITYTHGRPLLHEYLTFAFNTEPKVQDMDLYSAEETHKQAKMDIEQPKEMTDIHKQASVSPGISQDMRLDPELEKTTLRRFDMFLLPQIAIIIVIGYLDRSNIGKSNIRTCGWSC